jgi:hypothetical protein
MEIPKVHSWRTWAEHLDQPLCSSRFHCNMDSLLESQINRTMRHMGWVQISPSALAVWPQAGDLPLCPWFSSWGLPWGWAVFSCEKPAALCLTLSARRWRFEVSMIVITCFWRIRFSVLTESVLPHVNQLRCHCTIAGFKLVGMPRTMLSPEQEPTPRRFFSWFLWCRSVWLSSCSADVFLFSIALKN